MTLVSVKRARDHAAMMLATSGRVTDFPRLTDSDEYLRGKAETRELDL